MKSYFLTSYQILSYILGWDTKIRRYNINLPFLSIYIQGKLTSLLFYNSTPTLQECITAAIYKVDSIYMGKYISRVRQGTEIRKASPSHPFLSLDCGRKGLGSRSCHCYSGPWEGPMPSSVHTEKIAPWSETPGHGGRNTDIWSKMDLGWNPYSAIYLVFSLKQTAFSDA